ncbi:metallophosphoesterase 1 isoform X1 [Megalobrama amblycephala]|uniref:metallophosphoesterase 1 isoform X1 n=1 Tax=Megalobrama amblycephala TaxID=75352 RepID=UPI00201439F9|nr:metallophosphoesterase 1 isoform X1 [Megalobrama amblycephala]
MISMFGSSGRLAVSLIFAFVSVFILCEYVIYYPVIMRCSWPHIETEDSHSPLRALFLSDTHLLGAIRGHWLDKLRREWQMERAFQTSLWLLNPEVVFILGDVFDEGKWSSSQDWEDDVRRFKRIFRHSSDTKLVVLIGNHDIGFHNEMTKQKLERFEQVFNVTSARILTIRGVNFLLVNSVALHGDHCPICQRVEEELHKLSYALNCSFQGAQHDGQCKHTENFAPTAPILLQHYPLYRESDAMCTDVDAAPLDERYQLFRERYDVISKSASKKLLWWFKPRLILSGHTHNGCEVLHEKLYPEISVPSFSWRNRNNPSFILGIFSRSNFRLSKCFLPEERSVLALYCTSCLIIALITLIYLKMFRRSLHLTNSFLAKYKTL